MQHWPAQALQEAVAPHLSGFSVEVLPRIDSTNAELMRRARAGRLEPTLLVAEQQTAGRGRQGRPWVGAAEAPLRADLLSSLTFSLGLPLAPRDWLGLSLAVGVSVAESLQRFDQPLIELKWPNDLWCHDCKLAGILIETASLGTQRYVVVGVGINIDTPNAQGLSTPPVGLRTLQPGVDAPATLAQVVPALVQTLLQFETQGWSPFALRFQARDALFGREVTLSETGAPVRSGVAQGVDTQGALRVRGTHGVVCITSGEVSVRPAARESSC